MTSSNLSTLVTYNPWSVAADTTLDDAVRMLDQMGLHHWPVVDEQHQLVGLLSGTDIVRAVVERHTAAAAVAGGVKGDGPCEPCLVRHIMSPRVMTIDHHQSPHEALEMMLGQGIHSLPVLDEGRLIGMITSGDFLRELSYGEMPVSRASVSELMVPAAEPIDVDASLDEAIVGLHLAESDYVAVVQGDFPLGVISRRELRKAKCRESARELLGDDTISPGPMSVRQLITQAPTVLPGQAAFEATCLMVDRNLQAVAVVNRSSRLLGIVSEDQLLQAMLEQTAGIQTTR